MDEASLDKLAARQLQLILTYAPAGLGHLRVTDALYHGLPEIVNPVVLGSRDKSLQAIHRITSIHPLARSLFEWLQAGPLAYLSNKLYRASLRSSTRLVYEQLNAVIDQKLDPPKEVLVISTHFGLAHKLAAIKDRVRRERQVAIFLVVVVTDDTFQYIWYVDGADLIVVPSHFTKEKFVAHGKSLGGKERIEVLPYPVSQGLGRPLNAEEWANKISQLDAEGKTQIEVSVPVSGAAVGTDFLLEFIASLRQRSERFFFHVVSKDAPYTKSFLATIGGKAGVDAHVAHVDREVVDAYDDLYAEHVVSLEVTKPSEQAFKALVGTQQRGGAILLLLEPVGKQEFDNIDFLQRHFLIPSNQTNAELWAMADNNAALDDAARARLLSEACAWRGVRLPKESQKAANFVWWMLSAGVFAQMLRCEADPNVRDEHPEELGSDGVARLWNLVVSTLPIGIAQGAEMRERQFRPDT